MHRHQSTMAAIAAPPTDSACWTVHVSSPIITDSSSHPTGLIVLKDLFPASAVTGDTVCAPIRTVFQAAFGPVVRVVCVSPTRSDLRYLVTFADEASFLKALAHTGKLPICEKEVVLRIVRGGDKDACATCESRYLDMLAFYRKHRPEASRVIASKTRFFGGCLLTSNNPGEGAYWKEILTEEQRDTADEDDGDGPMWFCVYHESTVPKDASRWCAVVPPCAQSWYNKDKDKGRCGGTRQRLGQHKSTTEDGKPRCCDRCLLSILLQSIEPLAPSHWHVTQHDSDTWHTLFAQGCATVMPPRALTGRLAVTH